MVEKKRINSVFVLLLIAFVILSACQNVNDESTDNTVDDDVTEKQLVVYSARNENFVQPLLDKFEADTGIKVIALHGAEPLQLVEEQNNVQADVYISNDLGALGYLAMNDVLTGTELEGIESIPADFRAEDNSYFAISARARGFIYNKDLIDEADMPKSVEDLFDLDLSTIENGYAITRGGNGGMIGHVSALRYEWGDERTAEWIETIRNQAAGIYNGHGDIRRAVGEGQHAFGLVNNYYFHQQLLEPTDNNVGFIYLDQEPDQMGAVANAAGAGLVAGGPNQAAGIKFLEWLLEPENQVAFVGESLELLINAEYGAEYPEEVAPYIVSFDELHIQEMPVRELGQYFEDTRLLIESSGLDLELR